MKTATFEEYINGNPNNDADISKLNGAVVIIPENADWGDRKWDFYQVPKPGAKKIIRWNFSMGVKEFLLYNP